MPFAIILLCDRVETNSINPVSQGKVTGQKPCIHAGLRRFDGHSHSIVAVGLGDRSTQTRFTPFTSCRIREVIVCNNAQSNCGTCAVIASMVFTARIITGQSKQRALSRTPTDLKSGTIVKYCQTFPSKPALANSSRRMASDSRTASKRSRVIAPKQRTPNPGPGNGCRYTMLAGNPNATPQARTSSLNNILSGSTSSNCKSSGKPPTL